MTERRVIGFDRRLELSWLDATAARVAEGASPKEVRGYLHHVLAGAIGGEGATGARGKTVTVLMRTWSLVPPERAGLRDRALALLRDATPSERVALHWAMLLAAYPIVTDVASAVGRLLKLQGTVDLASVRRRLTEAWGETTTVERAAQRTLRTMVALGLLGEGAFRGVYERAGARLVIRAPHAICVLEAIVHGSERRTMPSATLLSHPSAEPFEIRATVADLRVSPGLEVHRQGEGKDVVALAGVDRRADQQPTLVGFDHD